MAKGLVKTKSQKVRIIIPWQSRSEILHFHNKTTLVDMVEVLMERYPGTVPIDLELGHPEGASLMNLRLKRIPLTPNGGE